MQRYFAKGKNNQELILHESDLHHIKNVMRGNVGDYIEVVYSNTVYLCNIDNLDPLMLSIIDETTEDRELDIKLTIAISLVSEQKFDLILQKLTELGVHTIIPVKTKRSIVKLDDKKIDKKLSRWKMICKEASEQSKRTSIPEITGVMTLKELTNIDNKLKLICSLSENTKPFANYLATDNSEMLFVIGPEGGFTNQEEQFLLDNNFKPVSLGKRVMRVETAAIYVASIINYVYRG